MSSHDTRGRSDIGRALFGCGFAALLSFAALSCSPKPPEAEARAKLREALRDSLGRTADPNVAFLANGTSRDTHLEVLFDTLAFSNQSDSAFQMHAREIVAFSVRHYDKANHLDSITVATRKEVEPGLFRLYHRQTFSVAELRQDSPPSKTLRVASQDGTPIAVECAGAGPTLVIVHGGIGDRTRWTPMFPLLSPYFTVCAMDRRGHGLSGDSPNYSLRKEAEDVASVVDSRPGTVFVLGHSYGGVAALEAMFLTKRVAKLILYEPPVQEPVERDLDVAGKMERLIKAGAREDATTLFLTDVVQLSPAELARMKARPAWAELVSVIDAQVRQMHALAAYQFKAERMSAVRQPTLLLIGSETTSPYLKQSTNSLKASLPHATRVVLQGQQHNAMDTGRDVLARAIIDFLLGTPDQNVVR